MNLALNIQVKQLAYCENNSGIWDSNCSNPNYPSLRLRNQCEKNSEMQQTKTLLPNIEKTVLFDIFLLEGFGIGWDVLDNTIVLDGFDDMIETFSMKCKKHRNNSSAQQSIPISIADFQTFPGSGFGKGL